MLRLLGTRRWLGYLALVVVFAVVCCCLGVWQWHRREEALAAIDRLESNYDRTPVALDDALPSTDDYDVEQQWTPVEITGRYLVEEQVLLRGRVRDTAVGFDVVVPFLADDGTILYVDRGWLPPGDSPDEPASDPATPTDELTIVVRLRGDEGTIAGRGAPEGQIASVDLASLAAGHDEPVHVGAYGLLATEDGDEPADVALSERPVLDEGPHLSYCLQWFVFALLGFIGFGWALRKEARGDEEVRPKRVRARTDAEIEDEILDRTGS